MQLNVRRLFPVVAACLVAAWSGCRDTGRPEASPPAPELLSVYVVHYPLQYFAERIGGELVEVHFPASAGADPAEWRPDEATVRRYQEADLVLLNGADYARWVRQVSLPERVRVDTSAGFAERLLEVPDAVVHRHGDGPAHAHSGIASHTWLDPLLAIEQARAVRDALRDRLPAHAGAFGERFEALAADLRALDAELEAAVAQDPERLLFASHPVYHYLEDRYGLRLESLHWEPDEMPGEAAWEAFDEEHVGHPAEWMLWEADPLPAVAERLAERGVRSAVFDPCAARPDEDDYLEVMRRNAENLRRVFSPEAAAAPE